MSKKKRKKSKVFIDYHKYIYTTEWKKRSIAIKKRDFNCCVVCGSNKRLHAHHKNYNNLGTKQEMKDCVTLCDNCHQVVHELTRDEYFSTLVRDYELKHGSLYYKRRVSNCL